MNTLLFAKDRYYVAGLFALCILSVASYAYAGNMFLFNFDKEYSLPSLYHYLLLAICCYGFYRLMQLERAYDVWFFAFAYLLVDDMTTLHETAGWLLGKYVIPSPLWFFSKRALGEISYLAVVGGLLGILLVKRFFAASAEVRKQFIIFACLIVLFALFGVLVDSIHEQTCSPRGLLCLLVGILEDGGEILVTIMIVHQIRQLLLVNEGAKTAESTLQSL